MAVTVADHFWFNPQLVYRHDNGSTSVIRVPAGMWNVELVERGNVWAAVATRRDGNGTFDLFASDSREIVWSQANRWTVEANTLAMNTNRVRIVGAPTAARLVPAPVAAIGRAA